MTKLNTPTAERFLARLIELLKVADSTFLSLDNPGFGKSLVEIPDLIAGLQKFLPGESDRRIPFWKCVVALNRAKRGLHLVEKIDSMILRAKKIPPGPFARVLTVFSRSKQPDSYQELLVELDAYLYRLRHDFS